MDFENSQTKKNLETAFAGESQAHTKYRYYASKAKKDGYVQISNIFAETAGNESEHAKLWFKYLHDGAVPGTLDNLRDAAAGENYEWTTMYDEFAKTAEEDACKMEHDISEQTYTALCRHAIGKLGILGEDDAGLGETAETDEN